MHLSPAHDNRPGLTPPEHEVLAWLGRGLANVEIADQLCIIGASNRTQALLVAIRRGLIDPPEPP